MVAKTFAAATYDEVLEVSRRWMKSVAPFQKIWGRSFVWADGRGFRIVVFLREIAYGKV